MCGVCVWDLGLKVITVATAHALYGWRRVGVCIYGLLYYEQLSGAVVLLGYVHAAAYIITMPIAGGTGCGLLRKILA